MGFAAADGDRCGWRKAIRRDRPGRSAFVAWALHMAVDSEESWSLLPADHVTEIGRKRLSIVVEAQCSPTVLQTSVDEQQPALDAANQKSRWLSCRGLSGIDGGPQLSTAVTFYSAAPLSSKRKDQVGENSGIPGSQPARCGRERDQLR